MNVIQLLDNELINKKWSTEQKARYLYLRSCQIFSYDPRYKFCDLLTNGNELKREIQNYQFDLENVTNFEITCRSYINSVYPRLLKELLNIKEVKERGTGHKWCEFNDGKRELKADATSNSDLTRVKMGLSTYGYCTLTRDYNFPTQLREIDKSIGYRNEEYFNEYINRRNQNMENEFLEDPYIKDKEDSDEFILFKWSILEEIYERIAPQLKNFTDYSFCISYLARELDIDLQEVPLYFIDSQEKWHFYTIYLLPLIRRDLYFLLERDNHDFNFYEIHKEEALKLGKTLKGINKNAFYAR